MYNIKIVFFIITTVRTSNRNMKENFLIALLKHVANLWYEVTPCICCI